MPQMLAEIVPAGSRSAAYALARSAEFLLSSLAQPLVGLLAEHLGFQGDNLG